MKNKIVNVPTIKEPIQPSPGFAKKQLADFADSGHRDQRDRAIVIAEIGAS